jgi:hypothetical protein
MSRVGGLRARRALRAATVAVGVVWLPLILRWGDLPHLLTFDDAFYYFTIGRNIADGAGSTFDGMHPTNGYHPLWMLVTVATYLVGFDGVAAIRALLVLQLATWMGALWVLGGTVAEAVGSWPAFRGRDDADAASRRGALLLGALWFALGANPFILKLFVNGMETGLAALVAAGLLALSVRHDGDPLRRPVLAGALLVLAFLARTDVAVVLTVLVAWTVARRRRIDRDLVRVGAVLAAVVVAYLATNVAIVDHPMQVSGTTKRVGLDGPRAVTLALCVAAAVGIFVAGLRLARRSGDTKLPRARRWVATTAWYPAGLALLLGYEWGFTVDIFLWHYAPQFLWGLTAMVLAVVDIYEGATVERPAEHAAPRSWAVVAILLVPFAAGGLWQVLQFSDDEIRSMQLGDRRAAEWIAANLPPDAVIASFDAGVLGYFAERPVVNIDGLVNSYEWYDAVHEGTEATRAFLLEAGVGYVANHGDVRDGEDPEMRRLLSQLLGDDIGQGIVLVHREDYVFSGTAGPTSGRRPYGSFVYELPVP